MKTLGKILALLSVFLAMPVFAQTSITGAVPQYANGQIKIAVGTVQGHSSIDGQGNFTFQTTVGSNVLTFTAPVGSQYPPFTYTVTAQNGVNNISSQLQQYIPVIGINLGIKNQSSIGSDVNGYAIPGTGGGGLPDCSPDQLIYYATGGTSGTCLTLGTNLGIATGVLNASGPAGVQGNLQQYLNGQWEPIYPNSAESASRSSLISLTQSLENYSESWIVAIPGDSILAGNGPPDVQDSFYSQTISSLKHQFGAAGTRGEAGQDQVTADIYTITGGTCTPAYGAGPGNDGTISNSGAVFNYTQRCSSGVTMTATSVGNGTDVAMIYYTASDSTTPTITIDGVAQSFTPAAPTSGFVPQYVDFGGLTASTNHTIVITPSGPFYPMMTVALASPTTGVVGINMAMAGSTYYGYNGTKSNFLSVIPNLRLVIGGEYANSNGVQSVAAVVAGNADVVNEAASLTIPFVLLITGPTSGNDTCTSHPCQVDYVNGLEAYASQNNIPVVDLYRAWGSSYAHGGSYMEVDGTHPNLAGSNDAAKRVVNLFRGFDLYFNDYNAGINISSPIDFDSTHKNPGFHCFTNTSGNCGLTVDGQYGSILRANNTTTGDSIWLQTFNGGPGFTRMLTNTGGIQYYDGEGEFMESNPTQLLFTRLMNFEYAFKCNGLTGLAGDIPIAQGGSSPCSYEHPSDLLYSSETVASSTTPTFSVSTGTSYNVLTANVTSFTLAPGADGQTKTLCFSQNSTGNFTVAPPANVHGFFTVGATASKFSCQSFVYNLTNSIWLATSPGVINE